MTRKARKQFTEHMHTDVETTIARYLEQRAKMLANLPEGTDPQMLAAIHASMPMEEAMLRFHLESRNAKTDHYTYMTVLLSAMMTGLYLRSHHFQQLAQMAAIAENPRGDA